MSWLNSSLNSLKGQITTFAQEVLAETTEDNQDTEDTLKRNEELNSLCALKDNEIASLRKQITELLAKNIELTRTSKLTFEKNASLEGSWCLEPENIPSDSSCKNDSSESSTGGDMITVPLDFPAQDSGSSNDKLQKFLDEKEERIKQLQNDNITLNDKVYELTTENRTLNASLDELDKQHNDAIQNLLESKEELKEKYHKFESLCKELQVKYDLEVENGRKTQDELGDLRQKFLNLEGTYMSYLKENEEHKTKITSLENACKRYESEKDEFYEMFSFKEKQLKELIEKITADKEFLEKENKDLHDQLVKTENDAWAEIADNSSEESQKEIESLRKKLSHVEQEKKVLQDTVDQISVEKDKIETDINSLRNNNIELERKCEKQQIEWEDKYKNLLSEKDQICTEIANLEDFIDVKDDQGKIREEMRKRIQELEKEVIELKSNSTSPSCLSDFEQKYNDLVVEKGQLQNEFVALEEDFIGVKMEMKNTIESLENELSEMKTSVNWKQKYEEVKSQKEQLQADFASLEDDAIGAQDELDKIRKELKTKTVSLEKEIVELRKSNEALLRSLASANDGDGSSSEIGDLILKTEKLSKENREYKLKVDELTESVEKCQANASEVESKLMMENVNLQKQLIDMESSINQNTTKHSDESVVDVIVLKDLFKTLLQIEVDPRSKESIETSLKALRDKIWKIDVLENNLKDMAAETLRLKYERDTYHDTYRNECLALMEGNEQLEEELRNLKRKKLGTIPENNEESLVEMEQQIEECNHLNRTLEHEYNELTRKLELCEIDIRDSQIKINGLQDINQTLNGVIKDLNKQIEVVENDKCNLIFEINEMKTDDKKSAMENELLEYKNKITSLENQLSRLNKDHSDLVAAMQSVQSNASDQNKENLERIASLQQQVKNNNLTLNSKEEHIKNLDEEKMSLKALLNENQANLSDNYVSKDKMNELLKENQYLQNQLKKVKEVDAISEEQLQGELSKTIEKQKETIKELEQKITEQIALHEERFKEISELKQNLENLNKEKNDLIVSITSKHNENTQYYTEIQRLSSLLKAEMEKSNTILANCENCKRLQADISNNQIEIEKFKDQINFLKEKSDILTSNLLSEQTNQKLVRQENMELIEKSNTLVKDLDRLREHLVEMQEAHTQDEIEMQRIIEEKEARISILESEISKSSDAFTSASIRANQHSETLQAQYSLLTQQRDDLAAKLSAAEDKESKNQAALVNLQCALEQFQKEKDKDIESATYRIRKELESKQDQINQLRGEIKALQQELIDANQGLLAAARLSDQLETSQVTITTLQEEITSLQGKNNALDEKLKDFQSSQDDKVDRNLIKSLLVGYIVSNNQNDKLQILKLISSVLAFNQAETDKVGLNKTQVSWLTGILGGHGNTNEDSRSKESLAKAFVNFLERESLPRSDNQPNLLNMIVADSSNPPTSSTKTINKSDENSDAMKGSSNMPSGGIQPVLLSENVFDHFAPTRNSSSILKNILNDS